MTITSHTAKLCLMLAIAGAFAFSGCRTTRIQEEDLIPARDVLNASCCKPDTETEINFLTLRQQQPEEYVLDKGDTLGVYIQGITGDKDVPPPVHFPEDPSNEPALGYPVPIRDDGYISLPLVSPIRVTGLTLGQAETRIRQAYTKDKKILLEGSDKIIVTLMKRRTYNVLVIREDASDNRQFALRQNEVFVGQEKKGETFSIELTAYENDVLHALSETGGMPGENALNEILVLRGGMGQMQSNDGIVRAVDQFGAVAGESPTIDGANVVRIPIRGEPGSFPVLTDDDVTLRDGDVLFIRGRDQDVFYTGGLLDGGRYPIPRDYEIDVLEAISMSGGNGIGAAGGGGAAGIRGVGSIMPATQVTVIRKCGCEQVAIDVDLRYAMTDPRERVIVQPGDLIILEYRQRELVVNSLVSVLQFGGIFNLFR